MASRCVRCGHELEIHRGWWLLYFGSLLGFVPAFLISRGLAVVCGLTAVTVGNHLKWSDGDWCPHCKRNGSRWP
jgi:hypothetical protein